MLRLAGWTGLGLAAGLAPGVLVRGRARPPGPPCVWVADRGAGRLIGLDRDLFVAGRVAVECPVALALRSDGGLWVARALEGHPGGAHRLELAPPAGPPCPVADLGALLDLEVVAGERALVVHTAGGLALVQTHGARGSTEVLLGLSGASCAAGAPGRTLVGTADGRLLAVAGATVTERPVGRRFVDLAPGPGAGTWWALDAGPPARLLLVDAELAIVRELFPGSAAGMAPVPGAGAVWVLGGRRRQVQRLGARGAVQVPPTALPMRGVEALAATADGGLLAVAPGAVMRLGPDGRPWPGQGGFDHLVGVSCRP